LTQSSSKRPQDGGPPAEDPRERILRTAYELFCRHGIHPIGVDRITAEAGVAKMTLYRHFRSKNELAVAVLDRHAELWTRGWLAPAVEAGGHTAEERLLAIFDAFDVWFRRDDFRGCFFTNSLLESRDARSPIGAASAAGLAEIRALVQGLAAAAGVRQPEDFAIRLQTLMVGSIVAASWGERDAARRARITAIAALEQELSETPQN
jgi:AcrR family transcriptional regulator